jgi:ankyrin repeat protein
VTEREVSTTEGFELALSLDIEFFIECSAKNCVNIEKAFYDLIRSLRAQKVGTEGLYERKQTVFGSRLIIPEGEDKTSSGRNKLARSLVHAARTNNLKEAMEFLDAGADVNAQPSISGSALHEAAAHGYETMVSLLLKSGAGINSRAPSGISPLQGAAAGGHFDVVKSLIQQGANRDQFSPVRGTALHAAASRGQAPVVKYLLKQGSNPNEAAGPYEYALHAGSWFGSVGVVNALLDNGADMGKLTEEGCTPLHMAAFTGNVDVLQILINRGGKLYINTVSTKFGTALDAADKNGHFEAVQLLLEEKATKSGLQPRTLHERPNLVYPQQTGRADEPSRSIDNNDHKDKVNSDGPVQQKSSNESSKSMEETNGVVLTSKFDFGFSSSQKPPVDLTPRPLIQDLGFTTLHDPPNARAE